MNTSTKLRRRSSSRAAKRRLGITMLELVIAGSMLATVMASVSVVLRTARVAWEANDDDYGSMHHALAVTRHFVRQGREARSVVALSSSSVTLAMQDGSTQTWRHAPGTTNGLTDAVLVHSSATNTESALAYQVRKLTFQGFRADGVTKTTVLSDIRLIETLAEVAMQRGNGQSQEVATKVWIRSW